MRVILKKNRKIIVEILYVFLVKVIKLDILLPHLPMSLLNQTDMVIQNLMIQIYSKYKVYYIRLNR